jgi:site-specific DNA recombinase
VRNDKTKSPTLLPLVRCAVYTRKSTEEGLEQEFNTLDAQRESGEAYVRSQAGEGWSCLPDRYDDGGYTGGNMERPALKRLMADIKDGKVDCVVVYKVDRLSRSLLDFARMMQVFEERKVSFVSVTQQFNTATSMGRLILNVLLSFAQFEREIISERTRDKIALTRRKGKWAGGHPPLGYDADPKTGKLVVNEAEAVRVRAIFQSYLRHEALMPVVQELAEKRWLNKRWTTKAGKERGGHAIDKTSLHRLLTCPLYLGKVSHKGQLFPGEHQGIIDPEVWKRAQALLRRNGRTGGAVVRGGFGALLRGLLHCRPCGCAMTPSQTKKGAKRYHYYTCVNAQKRGWGVCPSKAIPAAAIEGVVVEQLRAVGKDPALLRATLAEARRQDEARVEELEVERRGLERELARLHAEARKLAARGSTASGDDEVLRVAELQERIQTAEGRLLRVREQTAEVRRRGVDEPEVTQALAEFMPLWESLSPAEQARAVRLLVERVEFDGGAGRVVVTFHETGLQTLAERAQRPKERIA